MPQRVFVDANVLFSKTTMDWLFLLRRRTGTLFTVLSTEDVIAEVISSMRKRCPQLPGHVTRRRHDLLVASLDEVVSDFSAGYPFTGTDPHDYHVHAAAVAGQAHILLTANHPDDISQNLAAEPYELMHPDEFFVRIATATRHSFREVVEDQIRYWAQRPDMLQLDEALLRANCPHFAAMVRIHLCHSALEP